MSLQRAAPRTGDDIVQSLLKNSREEQSFIGKSSHLFSIIVFTISFDDYVLLFKNSIYSMSRRRMFRVQ